MLRLLPIESSRELNSIADVALSFMLLLVLIMHSRGKHVFPLFVLVTTYSIASFRDQELVALVVVPVTVLMSIFYFRFLNDRLGDTLILTNAFMLVCTLCLHWIQYTTGESYLPWAAIIMAMLLSLFSAGHYYLGPRIPLRTISDLVSYRQSQSVPFINFSMQSYLA